MSKSESELRSESGELTQYIDAQAHLHHAYFLGLQLMVSSRCGPETMGQWMFNLFRRQHEAKFLSSFQKLGLQGLPDAVACAQYHVLANNIGGVGVEYAYEHDRKAWVRFRYPRWMYHGPTICGIPIEVSRGFLEGWYAHNGVSLENPNLGFVCVSEDMTGEFGLCGYFLEYDHVLSETERLRFAKDESPPAFNAAEQPVPPPDQWNRLRLAKANRNYALEYVRNGLCELAQVLGSERASELGCHAAKLIGLQYFSELAEQVGAVDGDTEAAYDFLERMFSGMGDDVVRSTEGLLQKDNRALRGLSGEERELVSLCWTELFAGTLQSQRVRKSLLVTSYAEGQLWSVSPA
jgi:hypothetical protein